MLIKKKKSLILELRKLIKSFNILISNLIVFFELYKNRGSKSSKVAKTKKGRIIMLPKCVVCDSKKSRFIKEWKASR